MTSFYVSSIEANNFLQCVKVFAFSRVNGIQITDLSTNIAD